MNVDVRPLLVGEAPARSTPAGAAVFAGRSIRWMASLVGESETLVRERLALENLLDRYPGPRFPIARGRLAAVDLLRRLALESRRPSLLVLCGTHVARSFDVSLHDLRFFERFDLDMCAEQGGMIRACVMPHPSGLSRWWNHVPSRRAGADFLRGLMGVPKRWSEQDSEASP